MPLPEHDYDWQREERYSKAELFAIIDRVAEDNFYGYSHPLGQKLLAGDMTPEQLRFLATQEYPYYASTTWWNAFKLAKSDDLEQQRLLHGPLLDELGTDLVEEEGLPAHAELFLEYCEGIGLTRKEIQNAELVPGVVLAVTELLRIARERPQFEFLACSNLVIETMRPLFYQKLLEVFAAKYRWVPRSGLRFYEVHATHDASHTSIGRKVVSSYISSKRDQDAIFSAVLRSLCLRQVMYDGIFAAINDQDRMKLKPWPNFPREPWPRPLNVEG
ncbi:MAG: iron-containing redox enzyme family protein [Acidobacteriota bacterium]